MSDTIQSRGSDDTAFAQPLYTPIKRRSFFLYAGATAGATALALAGCSKNDDNTPTTASTTAAAAISLGAGDVGVLNYAYALEQLEAAFYAAVVRTPATDFRAGELAYFQQVAAHEAIHRDFLKAALINVARVTPIPGLTPDFSSITFTSRASVLRAAQDFEDLGVAAYNGAGKLLKTSAFLVLAGKIVSVEARHAAYIRDLILPGSFADDMQVNPMSGLDKAMAPAEVLTVAGQFIKEKLNADNVGK
ncbi:ferritin-like domain-containing protein [Hymenobacter sp. BT664]|uniref:Ferritin-like domain-containing protein n=1 Tax=Hymenobacter montanus TaxID=2771359 RepID=A0A927GI79_9BACT|nr:ferritin-like domain-containing protein [Hymenobacter montanus]MBD2767095.1 ferritin-like domain-containing protein [Hymenobacter montanus]